MAEWNLKYEPEYIARSQEQNYISKCFDEFTALSEEEAYKLKMIFEKYKHSEV